MGFDYTTVVDTLATWLADIHRLILDFRCPNLDRDKRKSRHEKILTRANRADLRLKIMTSDIL